MWITVWETTTYIGTAGELRFTQNYQTYIRVPPSSGNSDDLYSERGGEGVAIINILIEILHVYERSIIFVVYILPPARKRRGHGTVQR